MGVVAPQILDELETVHLGHMQVRENGIGWVLLHDPECLPPVLGIDRMHTVIPKTFSGNLPRLGIVIDDKDTIFVIVQFYYSFWD